MSNERQKAFWRAKDAKLAELRNDPTLADKPDYLLEYRAEEYAWDLVWGQLPSSNAGPAAPASKGTTEVNDPEHAFCLLVASLRQSNPDWSRQKAIAAARRKNPALHNDYLKAVSERSDRARRGVSK